MDRLAARFRRRKNLSESPAISPPIAPTSEHSTAYSTYPRGIQNPVPIDAASTLSDTSVPGTLTDTSDTVLKFATQEPNTMLLRPTTAYSFITTAAGPGASPTVASSNPQASTLDPSTNQEHRDSLRILEEAEKREIEIRLDKLGPSLAALYNSSRSTALRRRSCTPNTCIPVLNKLKSWASDGTEKIYWLNGMPGTGKTTIAYNLSGDLAVDFKLAASFFCSRQLPDCRDANRILPTISYQLARFSIPFRGILSDVLQQDPDIHTRWIPEQFKLLIADPLRKVQDMIPENLVVVIDGLDECEEKDAVDLILSLLISAGPSLPLKFFITSRPEPTIVSRMQDLSNVETCFEFRLHELEHWVVHQDIDTYIKDELGSMDLSAADLAKLTDQCGVLFAYAAATVRYLRAGGSGLSHKRLKAVMDMPTIPVRSLERMMDDMYLEILGKAFDAEWLEEAEIQEMMHMLHTVACAQEPLTPEMIAALPNILSGDQVYRTLAQLSSILHYSVSGGGVFALHSSFFDFIFDEDRSGRFHCKRPAPDNRTIGTSMHYSEVVKILVNYACPDITAEIVIAQCSTNPIAGGGFGDIYRGKLRGGTEIAIKCARMFVDYGPTADKTLKRAAQELYVWSKSTHENVLELLGLATFRGQIAMISPWMENGTLVSYIEKYPDCDRCLLSAQIAEGLLHLHTLEIIHGDLKGQNVLVAEDGTAKLTDFGNVISNQNSLKFTTTTTKSNFSLRWTAPELLLGKGTYSVEADVYALGMTILETHTGHMPYPEKADPAVMGAVMINMLPPTRPEWCIPPQSDHGDKLWDILMRSWAHEPNERPSVIEMRDNLKLVTPDGLKQHGVPDESPVVM